MSLVSEVYGTVMRPLKRPMWQTVYRLTGRRLCVSTHIHDMSFISADFRVPIANVADLVPCDCLRIIPLADGDGEDTALTIRLNEFHQTDILRPYNEIAVCVTVEYTGSSPDVARTGYLYLYLPVTSEDARWPGVKNYGFPKFQARIDVEHAPASTGCHWVMDGKSVLSLEVPHVGTRYDTWQRQNFTVLEGQLLGSTLSAEGRIGGCDCGDAVILGLGDHTIGYELRARGVWTEALRFTYAERVEAVLSKPVPLAAG